MIPKDAPKADWHLYYDNTYMVHVKLGPCYIRVDNDGEGTYALSAYKIKADATTSSSTRVDACDLRIMWPRPGAYNFPKFGQAAFIGRTPQRHMKRSAYSDHYYLMWAIKGMTHNHIMQQMCVPAPYWTVSQFRSRIKEATDNITAAISSKVVLTYSLGMPDIGVIYMAESIGQLEGRTLIPDMPNDSRLARMRRHLSTVGIS